MSKQLHLAYSVPVLSQFKKLLKRTIQLARTYQNKHFPGPLSETFQVSYTAEDGILPHFVGAGISRCCFILFIIHRVDRARNYTSFLSHHPNFRPLSTLWIMKRWLMCDEQPKVVKLIHKKSLCPITFFRSKYHKPIGDQ